MCFYFILLRDTSITINNRVSFASTFWCLVSVIRLAVLGSAASGGHLRAVIRCRDYWCKKNTNNPNKTLFWFEFSGTGC